ncbi:hypothetical protein ACTXT7_001850 [Hymenolepis weldensis]
MSRDEKRGEQGEKASYVTLKPPRLCVLAHRKETTHQHTTSYKVTSLFRETTPTHDGLYDDKVDPIIINWGDIKFQK